MRKIAVIFGALLFLASCASHPRPTDADRRRVFPGVAYEELYAAVEASYRDLKLVILGGSREGGSLLGRTKSAVAWSSTGMFTIRKFHRYYETVFSHAPSGISVQIMIYTESEDGISGFADKKDMYDQFWDLLYQHLNHRMKGE